MENFKEIDFSDLKNQVIINNLGTLPTNFENWNISSKSTLIKICKWFHQSEFESSSTRRGSLFVVWSYISFVFLG